MTKIDIKVGIYDKRIRLMDNSIRTIDRGGILDNYTQVTAEIVFRVPREALMDLDTDERLFSFIDGGSLSATPVRQTDESEANLGMATTDELLTELRTRIGMDFYAGGGGLGYSTAEGRGSTSGLDPTVDATKQKSITNVVKKFI